MSGRTSRVGLGRHGGPGGEGDDPLDGLVNLFDVGLVLAVAFLVAGLGLQAQQASDRAPDPDAARTTLTTPAAQQRATGQGQAVGQVFRLADGRLVLVGPGQAPPAP